MAKIRVLHVCNQLELGGTEKVSQVFCQYLDKSCFEVFVCGGWGFWLLFDLQTSIT